MCRAGFIERRRRLRRRCSERCSPRLWAHTRSAPNCRRDTGVSGWSRVPSCVGIAPLNRFLLRSRVVRASIVPRGSVPPAAESRGYRATQVVLTEVQSFQGGQVAEFCWDSAAQLVVAEVQSYQAGQGTELRGYSAVQPIFAEVQSCQGGLQCRYSAAQRVDAEVQCCQVGQDAELRGYSAVQPIFAEVQSR